MNNVPANSSPTPSDGPACPGASDATQQPSPTGQLTPPGLDPEALANLDAVCQAVKKQVLQWGPKAKWKIDLLLLPDTAQDSAATDPTSGTVGGILSPPNFVASGKNVGANGAQRAPHSHVLSGGSEASQQLDRIESSGATETQRMNQQLTDALERVRILETTLAAQQVEVSTKLADARARAEKSVADALAFTKHMQRQESELAARHEVERRLCESEVRMLKKKLQDLTGARTFAAMTENGVGRERDENEEGNSEEERRRRKYEDRVAQAELAFLRERRQFRKKLRASETRAAQRETELDQAREQVAAYANYAHQLQAHLLQQQQQHYQPHQPQQQHMLHVTARQQQQQESLSLVQATAGGQPRPQLTQAVHVQRQRHQPQAGTEEAEPVLQAAESWARTGSSGERLRVRSGLDDLLAAAAEAEHAETTIFLSTKNEKKETERVLACRKVKGTL